LESKREKSVFSNIEDAKSFRAGAAVQGAPAIQSPTNVVAFPPRMPTITFRQLVEEWKSFHFLTLQEGTKLLYERKLPPLDFLNDYEVKDIGVETVDELVKFWVREFPKGRSRESFEKELNLLTVILNFYRKRKNRSYVIPVDEAHYQAATIRKKGKGDIGALLEEDLARFITDLKERERNPIYHPLALSQFGLSLRIGEACGLAEDVIDLARQEVKICRTVIWNDRTWEASLKEYPKNEYNRTLSIPDFLVPVLREQMKKADRKTGLLFHKNGELLNRKSVATAYNRSLQFLGITYTSGTHMMRKTSATCANEATGDFFAVAQQLDHASPEVTKRYVKPVSSQKRKVASALDGVFRNALKVGGT
jgi:integrase